MTAKQKRTQARLEQIKEIAAGYAANAKSDNAKSAANLAEEAAGLGLELLEEKK